ncbi:MAG: hypothetical protein DRQ55_19255 [Planctomycetota bacterium]|nr:MAG: hypothetical protein DRQ55_19255 [Planctomycetota bacterium]
MSTRSHWISVGVFFVVGALSGVVGVTKLVGLRQDSVWTRMREAGMTFAHEHTPYLDMRREVGASLLRLELEADGHGEQACAMSTGTLDWQLAAMRRMPGSDHDVIASLAQRLEAYKAGAPPSFISLPQAPPSSHVGHDWHAER